MRECRHCGHPATDHLDRAVVPCAPEANSITTGYGGMIVLPKNARTCVCPGYEAKHADG